MLLKKNIHSINNMMQIFSFCSRAGAVRSGNPHHCALPSHFSGWF